MKRVFSILYIICCCTLESADAQSAGISEVLKELQMENISVVQKQDTITAAFETSVYRGSYNGIGIAIRRLITLPEVTTLQLVILAVSYTHLHPDRNKDVRRCFFLYCSICDSTARSHWWRICHSFGGLWLLSG